MHALLAYRSKSRAVLLPLGRLAVVFLPLGLFLTASLRCSAGPRRDLLWLGTLFQALGLALLLLRPQGGKYRLGTPVMMLYVVALAWLLLAPLALDDWFFHLAQALLVIIPLLFFGWYCLRESGALTLRHARLLAEQLARRLDWPTDLTQIRLLREVRQLREAMVLDTAPALNLLGHSRLEVRVAALAALEYRSGWEPNQPDMILQLARQSIEPEVRASAMLALASVEDRVVGEAMGEFLYDPALMVRQAAGEALLWNTEERWPWLRHAVRYALNHPATHDDGPLFYAETAYSADAVADLTAWAADKGQLSLRAALTVGAHYQQALTVEADPEMVPYLRTVTADVRTPAMLRLELTRLLAQIQELDDGLLHHLIDPSAPAPVRLIAVETLLAQGDSLEAVAALHELARLPNREIALATAEVVQRRLGIDMGLPRAQPLPPIQSRQAADVARRVLVWANQLEGDPEEQPAGTRSEE